MAAHYLLAFTHYLLTTARNKYLSQVVQTLVKLTHG